MASTCPYFDSKSLFLKCVTEMTTTVLTSFVMQRATEFNLDLSGLIDMLFKGKLKSYMKLDFQRCFLDLSRFSCNAYAKVHQEIIEKKLKKSDLNPANPEHSIYLQLDKLLSQNNGYKHLNCLYDGFIMFSMLQFQYVSTQLSRSSMPKTNLSVNHTLARSNMLELQGFTRFLQENLTKANENIEELFNSNDQYKDRRLRCEDDSCQLSIDHLKQLLKDRQESFEQQLQDLD